MQTQGKLVDIRLSYKTKKPVVSFEITGRPEDAERYADMDLDISFAKHRKRRGDAANRCLWWCLTKIAEHTRTDKWSVYLHELRTWSGKFECISARAEGVDRIREHWRELDEISSYTVEENGQPVTMKILHLYYGSSEMDSKEFALFLNGVVEDMKQMDLEIPTSEEMRAAIKDIERRDNDRRKVERHT